MENKNAFLVGAGEFDGFLISPKPADLTIAVDGGFRYLREAGIKPDFLLGDMDSIDRQPEDIRILRCPPNKDDTDMALAAACALAKGCGTLFIYGGMGGRLDHTIANLQLLTALSRQGAQAYLIGQGELATALTDGALSFSEDAAGIISVFCAGEEAGGVTEQGLKYTVSDAALCCDRPLGVSNEFIGKPSGIEVKNGTLLLFWEAKSKLPISRMSALKFDPEKGARALLSEMGQDMLGKDGLS